MFETTRFESEQLLPASAVIAVSLAAFGGLMTMAAPGILGDVDVEALSEQLPAAIVEAFDLRAMGTIEGFIGLELYQFVWLIGLGAYLAYSAAGAISGDIEDGRLDTVLAAPISRRRLLFERFLALLTPILVINAVVFAAVYGASAFVNEPIALADLAAVHVFSIPYFLACGAFGTFVSVAAPRRLVAEGIGAGAIVGGFLLQTLVSGTDVSWLGALAPMRYYDPLTILTTGEYDLAGAGILLAATVGFLLAGAVYFGEVDVQ